MSTATTTGAVMSPYFTGISILLVQLGGRFLTDDFLPSQRAMFNNMWVKLTVIFLILLTAIQNIWYAASLTFGYYIFVYVLFHPQHPLSIMPDSLRKYDLNKDGVITLDEIKSVIERERKGVDTATAASA